MAVTNLVGLFSRVAAEQQNGPLIDLIKALQTEPEPRHPHILQALDAFSNEAAKRGLEIPSA